MSGRSRIDSIPVAVSTLAVAALFQPLRRRVQAAVHRRSYRAGSDVEDILATFGRRTRDGVDIARLRDVVVATADFAVRLTSFRVWLRGDAG